MRRDWDLVRKIVLAVEDHPDGFMPRLDIEGYSREQIGYHAYLLIDAGLAAGVSIGVSGDKSPQAMLRNLTWAGHEFAESARDDSRWKTAMGIVKDKGGAITADILGQLLGGLLKSTFGIPS
jgi:hypothetical protein